MRFLPALPPILAVSLACLAACGGGGGTGGSGNGGNGNGGNGNGGNATGGNGGTLTPLCTMPTTVECSDKIILDMNLQADPAPGLIENTANGSGWTSKIDATAGGAFTSQPHSYVYGKFTDQGLTKVTLGDQDSLDSMDWDIAFRRYVVRINSADSGPSCVQAARLPGAPKFEDVTSIPENLSYHTDDYFTASPTCELIPDGTGLPDSPATALSSYWTYPGCVQMTDHVFVLALADGRHVKLIVDSYYSPTVQDQCDTAGSIPMSGTGSANFIVRWELIK